MSETPTQDNGGQAFPAATCGDWQHGMSLRDWFAGQALNARLSDPESAGKPDDFASDAYRYADAMLKARANYRED